MCGCGPLPICFWRYSAMYIFALIFTQSWISSSLVTDSVCSGIKIGFFVLADRGPVNLPKNTQIRWNVQGTLEKTASVIGLRLLCLWCKKSAHRSFCLQVDTPTQIIFFDEHNYLIAFM